jgi:hypothetical protein
MNTCVARGQQRLFPCSALGIVSRLLFYSFQGLLRHILNGEGVLLDQRLVVVFGGRFEISKNA